MIAQKTAAVVLCLPLAICIGSCDHRPSTTGGSPTGPLPDHPLDSASYDKILTRELVARGFDKEHQSDGIKEELLAELLAAKLEHMIGSSQKSVEDVLGAPFVSVTGELLPRLSMAANRDLPLKYAPFVDEELAFLNYSDRPLLELREIPYRELETLRAKKTVFPANASLPAVDVSGVYVATCLLDRPGPLVSPSTVAGYKDGVLVYVYRIWFVGQGFEGE